MNTRRPTSTSRPAVTFIEVVLGVVLMGLVATTLAAAVGAVGGSFQRQRDRIAAAELAGRILLMRVDDEDEMPDPSLPIGYGDREFRWTIDQRPTLVTLSAPARAALDSSATRGGVDLSRRIIAVTVTTWLAEDSGGAYLFTPDVPHAVLTRLVDPIDFSTHDSAERRLDTQQDIERFLQDFVNTTTGTVGRPGGRAPSGPGNQPGTRPGNREPPPAPPPGEDG